MVFEVGRIYNRRQEIHKPYGGRWQSGISTPADRPFIFLFSGESGEQYGYKDRWDENGVFLYSGEGQEGHMEFTRGNRAISDHAENGKDRPLFEPLDEGYRYLGMFACSAREYHKGTDSKGDERQVSVFHLTQPKEEEDKEAPPLPEVTLNQLCHRALEAASQAEQSEP